MRVAGCAAIVSAPLPAQRRRYPIRRRLCFYPPRQLNAPLTGVFPKAVRSVTTANETPAAQIIITQTHPTEVLNVHRKDLDARLFWQADKYRCKR